MPPRATGTERLSKGAGSSAGGPARDFEDELAADGAGEGLEIIGNDDEGAGAADDTFSVVEVEVRHGGAAGRAGPVVHDGKSVDGDVGGDGLIARSGYEAAAVVRSVARDVDDVTGGFEAVSVEEGRAKSMAPLMEV